MNWNKFRRNDGTIDLVAVFRSQNKEIVGEAPITYLEKIEEYQQIKSRQVAAHCLTTAKVIMLMMYDINL